MSKVPLSAKSFLSTADKSLNYSILGAFAILPLFVLFAGATQGQLPWGGVAASLILSFGFFTFLAMSVMDSSELIVDETGLSRKIGGRVCMQIPWTGISSIRETFQITKQGEHRIWIEVIPLTRLGFALRLRRSIVTTDLVVGFDELVAILNERVRQYSIRVQIRTNGIWKQRLQLNATWE